jgi:hypothetical protein
VNRWRGFCFFLLIISLLIPCNTAYLYQAYYEDLDLLARKHFCNEDEENLLAFIKRDPRVLVSPGPSLAHPVISFLQGFFFQPHSALPQDSNNSVLRC